MPNPSAPAALTDAATIMFAVADIGALWDYARDRTNEQGYARKMSETPSILNYSKPETLLGVGRRSRLCTLGLLLCIPCVFLIASDVVWRPLVSHLEATMLKDDALLNAWKILAIPAALNFVLCVIAAIRSWRMRYRGMGFAITGALICLITIFGTANIVYEQIHPRFHTA